MPRHKPASDPRGGHIRLYWAIVDSYAWRCLSATDKVAYIALQRQLKSFNNGDLSLPATYARNHGITSKTTLAKSLRALCAVGLIAITRRGGCKRGGQRLPTLYRLTDHQAYEAPAKHLEAHLPSNEWKSIQSIAHGRRLILEAEARAAELATMKKSHAQKLTHTGSENGPVEPLIGSENGPWITRPGQKMDHGKGYKNATKANNDAGFVDSDEIADSESHSPLSGHLCMLPGIGDSGSSGRRVFIVASSAKTPDGLEAVMTP